MIGYYKKSREDIVKIIKNSPITKDGYYYCKEFRDINKEIDGDILEKKYIYDRCCFENKICFNDADIKAYLETEMDCYDIYGMKKKDDYLYETIYPDLDIYKLSDEIDNYGHTFEEVIDTCIFIMNNKKI